MMTIARVAEFHFAFVFFFLRKRDEADFRISDRQNRRVGSKTQNIEFLIAFRCNYEQKKDIVSHNTEIQTNKKMCRGLHCFLVIFERILSLRNLSRNKYHSLVEINYYIKGNKNFNNVMSHPLPIKSWVNPPHLRLKFSHWKKK